MILRPVLDHYPAARRPDDPFVPSFVPWTTIGDVAGLRFRHLAWNHDARGSLVEIARESNVGPIAQAYITTTHPGVVKGFHLHVTVLGGFDINEAQTDRFVPLRGATMFVFYDLRPGSNERFHEFAVDAARGTVLIEVPPGVAHGWIANGNQESAVLNLPSIGYTGQQERRCDPHGPIKPNGPRYEWRRGRDG